MKVNVYRVREFAKIPVRAHETDAGVDLFFCPENQEPAVLNPGASSLFPTGVKISVPSDCMLQVMNKSGIASKRQLVTGACVVDEGYTGEVFVNLHNIGPEPQEIKPGEKIAQGVFVKIEKPTLYEVKHDNIYEFKTSRGSGALGSTGNV